MDGDTVQRGIGEIVIPKPENAGKPWSKKATADLVAQVREGKTAGELAAMYGRSERAIQSRLAAMIPASEEVSDEDVVEWLRRHLEPGDYPWQAVFYQRKQKSGKQQLTQAVRVVANSGESGPPPSEPVDPTDTNRVLALWQRIVGAVPSPEEAQRFRDDPDLATLCWYPDDELIRLGEPLSRACGGQLPLGDWARACTFGVALAAVPTWKELKDVRPDATVALRDIITCAIESLHTERHRVILTLRLGLNGNAGMTLRSIAEQLVISPERVRQLQGKAFTELQRRRAAPSPGRYLRQHLADVLGQAEADGTQPALCLLSIAEAVLPGVRVDFAVWVLAVLSGHRARARQLVAEARTILVAQRKAAAQQAGADALAASATQIVDGWLAAAEWPDERRISPGRLPFEPLRKPEARETTGEWYSAKLRRKVAYESTLELIQIKRLDRARQIEWFCEQPVAIGYTFDGRHRTYYPDLLIATDDGYVVLVEIKSQGEMPFAINQAKADAARAYCAENGWGYLCTDGTRHLCDLKTITVPEGAESAIAESLRKHGRLNWHETKAICGRHGITSLHVGVMAFRRGWTIRSGPYVLAER